MLTVSHNGNPIVEIKFTKNRQNEQGFSVFAISIVENLCLLRQYKWNTIKIRLHAVIRPYGSILMNILAFFISRWWKSWPLLGGYFGTWGHALVAVAVVERFKQEPMYGMYAGTKNGRRREVTIWGRWPLVEVQLYLLSLVCLQWKQRVPHSRGFH